MIVTTTQFVEGRPIRDYLGIVAGETIVGANVVRDFFASVSDVIGGRSGSYEEVLGRARKQAIDEMADRAHDMGGNAVVGVQLSYGAVGSGTMLMVTATGTAVKV